MEWKKKFDGMQKIIAQMNTKIWDHKFLGDPFQINFETQR